MDKVNVSVRYELMNDEGKAMEGHIVCPMRLPTYAAREELRTVLTAINDAAIELDKVNAEAKERALKLDDDKEDGPHSTRAMMDRIESVRRHQIKHAWTVFNTVVNRRAMTTDDLKKLDDPAFCDNCALEDVKRIGDAFRESVVI